MARRFTAIFLGSSQRGDPNMRSFLVATAVGVSLFGASLAGAAPIAWNTWSSTSTGTLVSGSDTLDISYAGNATNFFLSGVSYTPTSTWADGVVVDNGPMAANGILQLIGGTDAVQTLTFSKPVVDPVMAIWSLGQGGAPASFVFQGVAPVLISGGPNAEFGGSSIVVNGNTVSGAEGNGTIQFIGTFTSLSWTNPQAENWYGFNVGIAGVAPPVPEPATWWLLVGGLVPLAGRAKRRRTIG
jgi:hypothetical protein